MTLQIEEGKYYRTRDGRKVGPMKCDPVGRVSGFHWVDSKNWAWNDKGEFSPEGYDHLDDLVAEWKETEEMTHEDTPKLWKDMTDEEKGALLLAHHEGKDIQAYSMGFWVTNCRPLFRDEGAYRVDPRPKTTYETVTIYSGWPQRGGWSQEFDCDDTHKITFDLIDGVPDCDTIKMQRIEDAKEKL